MTSASPLSEGQLLCLCDSPKCLQEQCRGTRCFSSVRVGSGGVVFERGCLEGPKKTRLHCSTAPSSHQAIRCCSHHLCNGNTTRSAVIALLPSGTHEPKRSPSNFYVRRTPMRARRSELPSP